MQKLQRIKLGKTNLTVTRMGIGLWAIGGSDWGKSIDQDALLMIEKAIDEGILFYDTADVYGNGHSEELLGQVMKGRRDKFVIATKIGWLGFDHEKNQSAYRNADQLIADFEKNLKRLQTDYVDILQRHIPYSEPTYEVFLEGFKKLKKQGKIRYYGLSTSDFSHLKEFNQDGECDTLQIDYSILNRTGEADILPYCQQNKIGVIIRGGLAMGILADKLTAQSTFAAGDFRNNWINKPEENKIFRQDLDKVKKLRQLVTPQRSMAQLALQFILNNDAVSIVIPGARNEAQLMSNLQAESLGKLTDAEIKLLDEITPAGKGRKIWPA